MKRVFPALRAKLRERFVELVDVDLRWGITPEQAERGEVLPICLSKLTVLAPISLVFLESLRLDTASRQLCHRFTQRQPWLYDHRGGKSVTELEILHGVLNNPQMHGRAFFYLRAKAIKTKEATIYQLQLKIKTVRMS